MNLKHPRLWWSVTAANVVAAAVALAWPANQRPSAVPPSLTAPAEVPVFAVASNDGADRFVARNAFDPSRRPPAEREMAAVMDTFPEPLALGEGDALAPSPDAGFAVEPVPALHGVVETPSGRRALLRLDADKSRAALFGVGDGTAGWRVVQIGLESVTLDGPTGRQVVSLMPRSRTP